MLIIISGDINNEEQILPNMYKAWGEFIRNASLTENEIDVLHCDQYLKKNNFIERITKFLIRQNKDLFNKVIIITGHGDY